MGSAPIEASLIICSHNPRSDYFKRVLSALEEQSLSKDCWELILVDNRSLAPLALDWDLSWHPHARHIVETELGLAAARRRGIREALSDLLIFVDDDNVLCPRYIQEAIKIGRDHPFLGVWGSGETVPEFETRPDLSLEPLLSYLALRSVKKKHWTNFLPCPEATPWGAGLCVRSNVAKAYRDYSAQAPVRITGRKGDVLFSGEDLEISYVASAGGLGMGIFPELKLTHLIPKERLSLNYLIRVCEGTALSNLLLDYSWNRHEPQELSLAHDVMSILKNVLLRRGVDRQVYLANRRAMKVAKRIILNESSAAE
jgi:glycosyltransferase involved in cell wall biosynthesis